MLFFFLSLSLAKILKNPGWIKYINQNLVRMHCTLYVQLQTQISWSIVILFKMFSFHFIFVIFSTEILQSRVRYCYYRNTVIKSYPYLQKTKFLYPHLRIQKICRLFKQKNVPGVYNYIIILFNLLCSFYISDTDLSALNLRVEFSRQSHTPKSKISK